MLKGKTLLTGEQILSFYCIPAKIFIDLSPLKMYHFPLRADTNDTNTDGPANTQRRNNVVSTSLQRRSNVIMTLCVCWGCFPKVYKHFTDLQRLAAVPWALSNKCFCIFIIPV